MVRRNPAVFFGGALIASSAVLIGGCATHRSGTDAALRTHPAEGFVEVDGGRVWYAVRGSGTGTPMLVLHGGPGIPHDYLENLDRLRDERPIVFYDQLGCGNSDRPVDERLWVRERFAREVGQVRAALGLDEVVLYGHSWGSILAVDYLTGLGGKTPAGVRGVILAGPALSLPRWSVDADRLIAAMPPEHEAAIRAGDETGDTDTDAYHAAADAFYQEHVCRVDPWPDAVNRAFEKMGADVYGTMNGPNEFRVVGSLRGLDVTPKLARLKMPVLYICGQYDEATPESTRYYASRTPGAEVIVVPDASHLANWDRPDEYMRDLSGWMVRHGL